MNMPQQRFSIRTPINDSMGSHFRPVVTPTALPGADLALKINMRNSASTVVGNTYANEMDWLEKIAS